MAQCYTEESASFGFGPRRRGEHALGRRHAYAGGECQLNEVAPTDLAFAGQPFHAFWIPHCGLSPFRWTDASRDGLGSPAACDAQRRLVRTDIHRLIRLF